MVEKTKQLQFYFPNMSDTYLDFLSQCACAICKDYKNNPVYAEVDVWATKPLELLAIDLYEYDSVSYLTMIDLFSKFPFCFALCDKTAAFFFQVFSKWVSMYTEPDCVLFDNGGEFNEIEAHQNVRRTAQSILRLMVFWKDSIEN